VGYSAPVEGGGGGGGSPLTVTDMSNSVLISGTTQINFPDGSLTSDGVSVATITFPPTPAVWGGITGTIADQTDLQAAISGKMNKSGDTMTGALSMSDNLIANVGDPIQPKDAVNLSYMAQLKQWAALPDLIIAGTITRDSNDAATSAPVVWPDGNPGTFTATAVSSSFPGAVDAYTITYGSPVTHTYTQAAVTRNSNGAVTARPAITVS
jgi:hypothetical protein